MSSSFSEMERRYYDFFMFAFSFLSLFRLMEKSVSDLFFISFSR